MSARTPIDPDDVRSVLQRGRGVLIVATVSGRDYVLSDCEFSRDDPRIRQTLDRIVAACNIDLTLWRPARRGES